MPVRRHRVLRYRDDVLFVRTKEIPAQGLLGTATERETVEAALDLVISRNTGDLARIARITPFEFEAPFPKLK